MINLRQYHTGLWVVRDSSFPKGPFLGKGWRLSFLRDTNPYPRICNGSEVIVHARNWKTAQQATNLIHAGIILINGDSRSNITDRHPLAFADTDKTIRQMPRELLEYAKGYLHYTPAIPLACKIAIKASRDRHLSYALSKYYLSCELYSTPSIELDPLHSGNMNLSPFYDDHVRFAASIIMAYSVIEELDLHVKASGDKPSRLDNGQWNPEVKNELQHRLQTKGINLSETYLWSLRGPTRRIEIKRPPRAHSKPKWASGHVKDVQVQLIDAIADASWLRSKVSAHGFTQLASSLSPYDVANVQHLARRLILESIGYWRYHERRIQRRRHGN